MIEGQFYEMDQTFAKELLEKQNLDNKEPEAFSFLSMLGRGNIDTGAVSIFDTNDNKPETTQKKVRNNKLFLVGMIAVNSYRLF